MDRSARLMFLCLLLAAPFAAAGPLADSAAKAGAQNEAFVEGSGGLRFLPAELRFADKLTAPEITAMVAPAVEAIADFADQLKKGGISLVVVPVPPKALVHGASMGIAAQEQRAMQGGWEKIMAELGGQGVRAIDLLPDFLQAKEPVFCLRDTHWSGHGIDEMVKRLLPALHAAGIEIDPEKGDPPWEDFVITGDLGGEPETVRLRFPAVSAPGPSSPVLLLGDSHVLVFHQGGDLHTSGAGLPEQLADALGKMPEVMGVRGSGATSSRLQFARRARSTPEFLRSKKIVVWVFAGREFTEADMWKKIPVPTDRS